MNKALFSLLGFLLFSVDSASAALVGDTVSVDYRNPNIDTIFFAGNPNLTVVAGPSDSVIFNLAFDINVNLEDNQIIIDFFNGSSSTFTTAEFNGVLISEIDTDIMNVDVAFSTVAGFDNSRILFGSDFIGFNFSALTGSPGQQIVVNVSFVPIPAAVWLLGSAFMLLLTFKGRR